MKKVIIGFILGGIVFTLGGVVATTVISSSNVTYESKTVSSALDELYNSAVAGKEVIAAAITNKGISTTSNDTYETMATNINNIDTDHTEINQKISSLESKHTSDIASLTGSISNMNQSLMGKVDIKCFSIVADDLNGFFKELSYQLGTLTGNKGYLIGGAWFNHYYFTGHCYVAVEGIIYAEIYLGSTRLYIMEYRANSYLNVYLVNTQLVISGS